MTGKSPLNERMPVAPSTEQIDPLNVNVRLYKQISALLSQLETNQNVTLRERYMALQAIGRIQIIFLNLRKEKLGDNAYAGSAVKKYAEVFKADGAGGRKAVARTSEPDNEPDSLDNADIWGDDDDSDRDTA